MRCKKWQTDLVQAACGTLEGARSNDLEDHLARCTRCAAELATIEATLALLERHGHREPVDARLDHVWTRLEPVLDELDAGQPRPHRARRLSHTLLQAAAVLLVAAMGLVLWLARPQPPTGKPTETSTTGTTVALDQRYERYLQRTKPLLLAVANRDAARDHGAAIDAASERRLAQRLAEEASTLGEQLHSARRRRESELVTDLEVILRQLANLSDSSSGDGLALVQDTLEQRSILFQVGRHQRRIARVAART